MECLCAKQPPNYYFSNLYADSVTLLKIEDAAFGHRNTQSKYDTT